MLSFAAKSEPIILVNVFPGATERVAFGNLDLKTFPNTFPGNVSSRVKPTLSAIFLPHSVPFAAVIPVKAVETKPVIKSVCFLPFK